MTKYREIIRLAGLNLSQTNIALSCSVSKTTVNKVLKAAKEKNIAWPLDSGMTDAVLEQLLFPKVADAASAERKMPNFAYIRKELLKNGVNKKLLWTEYLEDCRLSGGNCSFRRLRATESDMQSNQIRVAEPCGIKCHSDVQSHILQ